ncbi:MAG TPA: hypothetical protein VGA40_06390 [Candidatus Acidoferrales bacterium]
MWNVIERFTAETIDKLPAAGFAVSRTGGVVRVEKYGCGAELRQTAGGAFQLTQLPTVMVQGGFARLWDAGYQKFFISEDGRKLPALAEPLKRLRRFNEELRTSLGVPTYYNEALGSTCHVTSYDRVKGRPGDVPDQGVGVKSPVKSAH